MNDIRNIRGSEATAHLAIVLSVCFLGFAFAWCFQPYRSALEVKPATKAIVIKDQSRHGG